MIFQKLCYCRKSLQNTALIFRSKNTKTANRNSIMPRVNKNYVQELQKQRRHIKALNAKCLPSRIVLQIIGNGTLSEPKCIILQTDHTNYLFNCGEGSQRLGSEHHVKLAKLEHIFLTRAVWDNMGGILGTVLTLQETGVPFIKLHGPEDVTGIIESTESFITLNQLKVVAANVSEKFTDHTMTVTYVPICNPASLSENKSIDDLVDSNQINSNGKRTHSLDTLNLVKNKSVDSVKQIDNMMIFICKVHDKIGSLNLEKCLDAGLKPGPALGKLKSGEDVTLPNGQIIKSKDMLLESKKGPLFIVLECPNENWIDNIVKNSVFANHQAETATNEDQIASFIVHFTPESVLNNSKYKEWMYKFGPKTEHLILNEKNTGFSSEAMYKMQYKLNLLNPTIFPLFDNCNQNKEKDRNFKDNKKNINSISNLKATKSVEQDKISVEKKLIIHRCKSLNTFSLRPFTGFDTKVNVEVNTKKYVNEAFEIQEFPDALAVLHRELNTRIQSVEDLKKYPKLVMLGTGSSIPNKVRNTSGILLQLDEDRSMILDCGEGTVKQVIRLFGETEGFQVLKTIKVIYVSHLHADHHLGLIGILKLRKQVTDEPIILLAPDSLLEFLNYYDMRFESIKNQYNFISLKSLLMDQQLLKNFKLNHMYETLNISKIDTVYVKHCVNAFAVAITLKDGRKICYSGDTMPCDNLTKLAQNSFLLIHEATMEDDLRTEAIAKRHSTISQAIETGEKAKVDFTLLTHFSQRYSKLPILPKNKNLSSVGITYDFMTISLSKIKLLSLFYPIASILFKDFQAILEERAVKREWKKEYLKKSRLQITN